MGKVVEEIVSDLTPFDVNDESVTAFEDRIERLEKVSISLQNKVYRLKNEVKAKKYKKKSRVTSGFYPLLQSEDSQDLCDTFSQQSLEERSQSPSRPLTYNKQPLNSPMSQRSRRRRVSGKRDILTQWSEEEGVGVTVLLGLLLHLDNYHGGDRSLSALGWKIFMGETVSEKPVLTVGEAIWLIEKSGMSQAVYQETRLRLIDRIYIPPVMHVRAENQQHRPSLMEYRNGVKAPLLQCLSLTLTERLNQMDLSGLDQELIRIDFKMGWGLDGSGEHSNYHQLSKVCYTTKQIMSVCFALRSVTVTGSRGTVAHWSSTESGANKPQNTRPLALFPAKESTELLAEFVPLVEAEVQDIETEGVILEFRGEEKVATCEKCNMSMIDGKMVTNLLNCGGSYCTMCNKSQEDCQKIETIRAGFLIERDVETIRDLLLSLMDTESGEVVKKKGDYNTRHGVCGQPLTKTDLTKNIPVCHSKIQTFEWITDLVVRNQSHKKWWSTTNKVTYTNDEKENYKTKRELVKEQIYQNLAINIGNPGDMVTGKAFTKFSSDASRSFYVSLVDENQREDFNFILLGLCATVKVINSQKHRINTDRLRELTQEVYEKIVLCFPWAVISPSVHRILAHSWEVIQLNSGFRLGDLSEEGLEALNKLIRAMRARGSRKDSTMNNFSDTFNHLWDRSRPTIVEMERVITKKKQKIQISTEIESLVESLFLDVQDE